jgi:hypothetical protein
MTIMFWVMLKAEILLNAQALSLYTYIAFSYSLRSIILFANMNVSRHILVVDTSVLAKSIMGRREYQILDMLSEMVWHWQCSM